MGIPELTLLTDKAYFQSEEGNGYITPLPRPLTSPPNQRNSSTLLSTYPSTMTTTKVTYTSVGSSGLRISNPILGAMSYGSPTWVPWCLESAEALPLLKSAYDQGINTWDTSGNYSNGLSESIIAQAVKTYAIPREKLVIMTKCYFLVHGELVYSSGGVRGRGLTGCANSSGRANAVAYERYC